MYTAWSVQDIDFQIIQFLKSNFGYQIGILKVVKNYEKDNLKMIYFVYFIISFSLYKLPPSPFKSYTCTLKCMIHGVNKPLKELLDMEWGSEVTDIGLHRWEDMTVPPWAAGDGEGPLTPRETAIQGRGSWGCVDLATERCVCICLE